MFQNTISNIILEIWPMIIITVVILTSLRIMDIIINKKKIVLYKDLLILLFAIYILCLFHIVTFQDVNFASSNFIPFKEMFRYELFSRLFIKNVMGNVLLFIPFGFFTSYLIKTKKIYVPVILTAPRFEVHLLLQIETPSLIVASVKFPTTRPPPTSVLALQS